MSKFSTASSRQLSTRNSDIDALAQRGYNIGHKIGEGSYATVITAGYADSTGQGLHLACKIIDKGKAPSDFVHKFFPRELEILTKIDHPNIIQIHSILQRGSKIFIFMRYAENGDLLSYIKKSGPVEELQAKAWFMQMAKAVKYLHSHDIAHRDLKCENILLSKRLNVKLADFGFARYCRDENGRDIKSETYCGSAAYAAPEVVSGRPYDPKLADAWSLGVILFIMLNAKMPFDDHNLTKLLEDQRNKKYTFRRKLQDQISAQAKATVAVLLEPEPQARWDLREILNCSWVRNDEEEDTLRT
ncbi:testis-specific serine/threonine-protein kinase 1 [Musca domestica]|uniref:Testis-specific serine/threonine-protein kinase 1 n=1 Tax=Musca domestica TaxID=7370 RepID=A0A1I8MVU7_MUSDO|nr:testis-specific serine/threonine-protein kinase 1 [Musca domestica]XP_058982581.1 testis-specific serine/threonine-protein kinase 1 [Musca domestica]